MCFKPMENYWFCMTSVYGLCVVVFDPSYLGLVLSLRDVALRTGTWCLEVALESFGVTFQVSRGRFRIFISWCPDVALLRFVVLSCERGLGVQRLLQKLLV